MSSFNEITQRARTERLGVIRAELARRLRPQCADWAEDRFLELIDEMADLQLKYELLERGSSQPDRQ